MLRYPRLALAGNFGQLRNAAFTLQTQRDQTHTHKISDGLDNQMQLLSQNGLPGQLMYFVYISEIVAPVLLLIGVFTRISSLTVVITMITVIYVIPVPLLGLDQHGASMIEVQLLYLLIPAALLFTGPGRYRLKRSGVKHWLLE